jgi:soluble lytic murein transglycosylase
MQALPLQSKKEISFSDSHIRVFVLLVLLTILAVGFSLLPKQKPDDTLYSQEIETAALHHGLDPRLVRAVIWKESRFRAGVRGRGGEIGLMQILSSGAAAEYSRVHQTKKYSSTELYNVALNLEIGCWYLGRAMLRYAGYQQQIELALAEYNAGESQCAAWIPESVDGKVNITLRSTKKYVADIMNRYKKYCTE